MDSRLKTSGMTEGGPAGMTICGFCHSRNFLAGIQSGFFLENTGFPLTTGGNDMRETGGNDMRETGGNDMRETGGGDKFGGGVGPVEVVNEVD